MASPFEEISFDGYFYYNEDVFKTVHKIVVKNYLNVNFNKHSMQKLILEFSGTTSQRNTTLIDCYGIP